MGKRLMILFFCIFTAMFLLIRYQVMESVNMDLSDKLYQRKQNVDGQIVILGIDQAAFDYIGTEQTWTRDVYADVIDLLNSNEEEKPAAIGIDVLFAGYSEEQIDNYFVETCKQYDNVVLGSLASFEEEISFLDEEEFVVEDNYVGIYEEPFQELKEVTKQGFLNNMLDEIDGIQRTGILHLDLPDGRQVNSFSLELYNMYIEKMGLEDNSVKIPLMNSNYHWYVPYSFEPNGCGYYSLSDVLSGDVSGEELADCIVLIGPFAEGMQDSFFTPLGKADKTYGVEIHANMIQAMINGNFKQYVPDLFQYILLFVIVVTCAVVFSRSKLLYSIIIWLAISLGYIILARFIYDRGYILQVVYIPVFITVIFIAEVGSKYVTESLEKKKVVSTFKRYVAPQVVDEIFKTGTESLELGGKMTDIACLFVDIRGFTPMSELLSPPEVVEILNMYLDLSNRCILQNEGTLDKFIGDATMAIFNAPLPLDDYVYKAVKTGWDMVQGSEELSRMLKEKYGRTVSFGIGIHCGKAVVGNIGTSMRMDYTAIGDTVNTAARLESNAKGGTILISRAVYDALEGRIKATSLGTEIKLKGKSEEFEIFEVDEVL